MFRPSSRARVLAGAAAILIAACTSPPVTAPTPSPPQIAAAPEIVAPEPVPAEPTEAPAAVPAPAPTSTEALTAVLVPAGETTTEIDLAVTELPQPPIEVSSSADASAVDAGPIVDGTAVPSAEGQGSPLPETEPDSEGESPETQAAPEGQNELDQGPLPPETPVEEVPPQIPEPPQVVEEAPLMPLSEEPQSGISQDSDTGEPASLAQEPPASLEVPPATPPEPISLPEKEKVQEKPLSPPQFDPKKITQEVKTATIGDVRAFVDSLNAIIRQKNFEAWKAHLTPEYIVYYSDPLVLATLSEAAVLQRLRIKLRTLFDYFTYVVYPSRQNVRVDDIEFVSEDRIIVISVNQKGERLVLYDLEKMGDSWAISTGR